MNLPEHGSFRRYVVTASVNFVIFYGLWELFVLLLPEGNYWPTVSWSIAWLLGSFVAHWTHRIWTFDSDRDTSWTIPASMGLYTIGWIGSTACYYIGTVSWDLDVRAVFIVNSSLWGVLNYLGQREIAFKPINTSPLS
jgi:putative flippase GtrA|tara:strand:- start:283 stop:696 length:414 start_codon:yes stop_codon:yes gene_type:complete